MFYRMDHNSNTYPFMNICQWRVCFRCLHICARISGQWSDDSVPLSQKR